MQQVFFQQADLSILDAPRSDAQRELRAALAALTQTQKELARSLVRERRARRLAFCDCLTSLPNRRSFHERFALEVARARSRGLPLTVLYLDLVNFKAINDELGHHSGDQVLRIIARRLARAVRRNDMVGRLGGDEFACLLTGSLNPMQLHSVSQKLSNSVSEPIQLVDRCVRVSVSIGTATCPGDGTSFETLLQLADERMYGSKRELRSSAQLR